MMTGAASNASNASNAVNTVGAVYMEFASLRLRVKELTVGTDER